MDSNDFKNALKDMMEELNEEISSIRKGIAFWNAQKEACDESLENLIKGFNSAIRRREGIQKEITLAQSKLMKANRSRDALKEIIESFGG